LVYTSTTKYVFVGSGAMVLGGALSGVSYA
jgi:hypothetical protein